VDWQLIISLVLVTIASCYLARRAWRLWMRKSGKCGGGCACNSAEPSAQEERGLIAISLEKLSFRPKK